MQFWVQNYYRVLPTDPRWLELDDEAVMALYWAHHYDQKGVPDEVVDENFDKHEEGMEQLFGVETPPAEPVPSVDEFEEVIDDRRN